MTAMGLGASAYVKPWDRPRPVGEARHDSHGPRCLGLYQALEQTEARHDSHGPRCLGLCQTLGQTKSSWRGTTAIDLGTLAYAMICLKDTQ
jgi:hypothetical protein